jgi:hypothetical protein
MIKIVIGGIIKVVIAIITGGNWWWLRVTKGITFEKIDLNNRLIDFFS